MSLNDTVPIVTDSESYKLKFTLLLVLQITSCIISSLIIIYIILTPAFRSNAHNRSICVLLGFNFIQIIADLPMTINFFRTNGIVQPAVSSFCNWWIWFEFSLNGITIDLMAWVSVERHLLIFHSNFMHGIRPSLRWLIQGIPLLICSLWGPLFTIVAVLVSPMCINNWIFDSLLCGLPCYLMTNWGTFDLVFNVVFPVTVILFANLALLTRILARRLFGMHRNRLNWQQQRKMVIQLVSFAILYLSIWLPLCIVQLCQIYVDSTCLSNLNGVVNYLVYVVPLLLPFTCLMSRPKIIRKIKTFVIERTNRQIAPTELN